PLISGLSTRVKQGTRLSAKSVSIVLWAAKIVIGEPLHGMRRADLTKALLDTVDHMSRIISPEIPAVVATQLITSRSWQSRAKARRTTSPFQQVNSRPSEHQRMLERSVATWPSCSRGRRRPA